MYKLEVREQIGGDNWFLGLMIPAKEKRPDWFMVIRSYETKEEAELTLTRILLDLSVQILGRSVV